MKNKSTNDQEFNIKKLNMIITEILNIIVQFISGGVLALIGLGLLQLILHGLNFIGVASAITATIWLVGCGAIAILFVLFGIVAMDLAEHSFFIAFPTMFFAFACVWGIFFFRALMFI